MIRKWGITLLLIFWGGLLFLSAQETQGIVRSTSWGLEAAYYTDDHEGLDSGGFVFPNYTPSPLPGVYTLPGVDPGRDLGSGWGSVEFQALVRHSIQMPFLQGDGPLTSGNNIQFNFRGNLAPVVAGIQASALWTPIAFLQLELGSHLGTGWHALGFNGMGLNNDGTGNPAEDSFAGVVSRTWVAGTFQFDLAAVMPGEWNHVVVLANARLEYQNYSAAEDGDAWQYESDSGENFNGFRYLGTYLLGYQMPLRVNTLGILVETEERLGEPREMSTIASGGWGSDFVTVRIAPVAMITLTDKASLTVLAQFTNDIRYTQDTIYLNWFQNRTVAADDTFWKFRRIAFSYSVKL